MRTVPALSRGLQILDLVGASPEPLRPADITRQLDLPRSAVYELVHTLVAHEMLDQRADGGLGLGIAAFRLGSAYAASVDLVREAQEVAREVMLAAEETVQVGRLDGAQVLYLAKADSQQMVRLVSAVGRRLPAHCTALGKMMLALLPPAERRQRLGSEPLIALTDASLTDPAALEMDLAVTAERGWAREAGESNREVGCVAAPVFDRAGGNVAAMSIAVPAARFGPEREEELRTLVVAGARRLSQRLGHAGDRSMDGMPESTEGALHG